MKRFQSIDAINSSKPSQLYTSHILDSTGLCTTKAIAPLESFLTLTSHYPVKVQTTMKGLAVRNPAILLLSMLTTDPSDQKDILQVNRNLGKTIVDESKGKRSDLSSSTLKIVEWVFSLIIAQHYKTVSPLFKSVIATGVTTVAYMGVNRTDTYGVYPFKNKFVGDNYYGEIITRLIEKFKSDPESMLEVAPPDIENCTLLGMPITVYRRSLSVSDDRAAPKAHQVFKLGISKSEKFLSE